jgi:serine/threonine protein kinase
MIGQGNFGSVHRGLWMNTTPVALKKLNNDQELDNEMNVIRSLNHPNTLMIRYFGLFQSPSGEKYLVMELMSLGSLNQHLLTNKHEYKTVHLMVM